MDELINVEKLFCDEYHTVILCEYQRDLALLKRLIKMAESAHDYAMKYSEASMITKLISIIDGNK